VTTLYNHQNKVFLGKLKDFTLRMWGWYAGREKYVVLQHVQNVQSVVPLETSVADPDPGSGAFLTPGSGMGK
jgi:hypothetical protein